jgi:hypothetical protein
MACLVCNPDYEVTGLDHASDCPNAGPPPELPDELFNRFLVATNGREILIQGLLSHPTLSQDHALLLAAWLVVVVGDRRRFNAILTAVVNR